MSIATSIIEQITWGAPVISIDFASLLSVVPEEERKKLFVKLNTDPGSKKQGIYVKFSDDSFIKSNCEYEELFEDIILKDLSLDSTKNRADIYAQQVKDISDITEHCKYLIEVSKCPECSLSSLNDVINKELPYIYKMLDKVGAVANTPNKRF